MNEMVAEDAAPEVRFELPLHDVEVRPLQGPSQWVHLRGRALEFGEENWRQLIVSHAQTWLEIALEGSGPQDDLYGGRLHEISAPTLFIHGRLDPRTEPGELEAVATELPHAEMQLLDAAGHSPHSEAASAALATRLAKKFLIRHSYL